MYPWQQVRIPMVFVHELGRDVALRWETAGCHSEQRGYSKEGRARARTHTPRLMTQKVLSCATCVEKVGFLPQSLSSADTKEMLENKREKEPLFRTCLVGVRRLIVEVLGQQLLQGDLCEEQPAFRGDARISTITPPEDVEPEQRVRSHSFCCCLGQFWATSPF